VVCCGGGGGGVPLEAMLTLAEITGIAKKSTDKNKRPIAYQTNLKAVCQSCHRLHYTADCTKRRMFKRGKSLSGKGDSIQRHHLCQINFISPEECPTLKAQRPAAGDRIKAARVGHSSKKRKKHYQLGRSQAPFVASPTPFPHLNISSLSAPAAPRWRVWET